MPSDGQFIEGKYRSMQKKKLTTVAQTHAVKWSTHQKNRDGLDGRSGRNQKRERESGGRGEKKIATGT